MGKQFMLALLVALVGVTNSFNPFGDNTCPCDTGGEAVDHGLPPIAEAAVESTSGHCRKGWYPEGDRCYYISEMKKTYDDAQKYCKSNGGLLVSLPFHKTKPEFDNLQNIALEKGFTEHYWIGIKMTNRFKGWKTQEDTVPIYRWTWAKGQPVYPPTWPAGFATCATLGTKKDHFNAYNFDCDSEQKFICVETCKDGWYYDSKKKECLFFSEEKKNWYDAKQFCEDEFWGSMPVYRIISDAVFTKETAIREGLGDTKYWTGVYQTRIHTNIWNGITWDLFKTGEPLGAKAENARCINLCPSDDFRRTFCDDDCTEVMNFMCTRPADY